jgi:hypothetical protein
MRASCCATWCANCITASGGISFWDEHELPRHFRRIHGDLTRLGGVQQARRDVAALLLERGAVLDMALTPAADAFRAEVRASGWRTTGTMPIRLKRMRSR